MPSGIDSRLTTALEQFTSASDATPGVVDSSEARQLIDTAKSIDKENASFFGLVSDGKARKQLGELLGNQSSKFEGTAAAMVDTYAETGRELDSRLVDNFTRFTAESDATPGVIDAAEAMKLIGFARTINRENRLVGALLGPVGTESVERLVRHTGEAFDTEATRLVSNFVGGQTAAREVSSWKSEILPLDWRDILETPSSMRSKSSWLSMMTRSMSSVRKSRTVRPMRSGSW